jgi:cytochrome oxidase Cu insertion factor (SCO1/SenC/PrrC family)
VRRIALLVVLVLLVSACGAKSDDASAGTNATTAAGAAADTPGELDAVDEPKPIDFELALADGSTFRLGDEEKPVYLVFWAEW